jgi:isoleucyl-tRNA synthetase
MFQPVRNKSDFPAQEREILALWEAERTFPRSLDQRRGARAYVFYDGPPFATGLPHYGHLLAGTLKDIVPRYQTMRGHYVERRFGWDTHGLPIEALAQEKLGLAGASAIVETGVDVFNETCRSMVLQYVGEWRKTVTRMGRWVDFDNDYKTMDPSFMESIWWVFKRLWEQGRVYKSHRIMPYSWKLNTPLSNFEANRNYQDVQDPAITLRFRLTESLHAGLPSYALAWTTTPWTLPGNLALAVGPAIAYQAVRDAKDNVVYLLARERVTAYYKHPADYEVVGEFTGAELAGRTYAPLLPYFPGHAGAYRVLPADFVSTGDGTGIVHLAPAFGEDDFQVCKREGIALADYLDADCKFTARVPEYAGQFCKDADKAIIRRLKDEGKLVHQSTLVHSYPFCERTDTPLIYRAIDAWYVRVEDLRERMAALNDTVHWVPEAVGSKRFGNWLREASDWNISRNRFWGSCIPVWVAEDGSDAICVGSIAELEQLSGVRVTDLHKHHVDQVTFVKDGKTFRRTPEVLDCWFESGAMPYAQSHYPFENKEAFEQGFPADFIAEGLDQTRGWFYTLMVLSTALFDQPAFRNVVVNGLILAKDGKKMSKRLKNYPDPLEVVEKYGADALRLYMIHSPVVRAENLKFDEEGVAQVLRDLLIPWWNAYSFFVTYANVDGWTPSARRPDASPHLLDRWILSRLERLNREVTTALDAYHLQGAVRPFVAFIEDLTNWYIRRSRRRFWKSDNDEDKAHAYTTLYAVLVELATIAAPFTPFISEAIHRNLRTPGDPDSVHWCDFPAGQPARRDPALEERMDTVLAVVNLGRALRSERDLKIRQPLPALHVITRDFAALREVRELDAVIREELNVKAVHYGEDETALADLSAKPNFKTLGKTLGPRVKTLGTVLAGWGTSEVAALLTAGSAAVTVEGETVPLTAEDVIVQRTPKPGLAVASQGALVIALDTQLTPALQAEGLAREFVNRVQNLRKNADLAVTERIRIRAACGGPLAEALRSHREYVLGETLGLDLALDADCAGEALDLNGQACRVEIVRA